MAKNANSVISAFTIINSLTTLVNVSVILKRRSNFSTLLRSEKHYNALAWRGPKWPTRRFVLGSLSEGDGDGSENGKKIIGLD